jgi:hypothetical protein
MRKAFFLSFLFPAALLGLEVQPWFGEVYEFHFLGSYAYSFFYKVQNSEPHYDQFFQSNLLYLGLDFSPSPVWSVDTDIQFSYTSKANPNFRSGALQARYLWLDDIIGDPISFSTGFSMRATSSTSLRDVSCPSHGNVDFELNFSLGKEVDPNDRWRLRGWVFGALGHANRGAPWVRAIAALEANMEETHKWALYADGVNGYGRRTHIDVNHFYGYAKYREKAIDLGLRYGYRIGVWGTLRLEYIRRVLAKTAPEQVNTFMVSYLLPFSF